MARSHHFSLHRSDDGKVLHVDLLDPPRFSDFADLTNEIVEVVEDEGAEAIVIDFGWLAYPTTAVMGSLVRVRDRVSVPMKLCGMNDATHDAFRRAKLEGDVFEIFETPQDAESSCE